MRTHPNQPELFAPQATITHRLEKAELTEYPEAFNRTESEGYFDLLRHEINWQSASIRLAGRSIAIPRLQCWVAESGFNYSYSGIQMAPLPWSATLLAIRQRVQELAGLSFNAVLLNLYRNGQDSVSWHADDEPELGPNPVVASVSFGASRPFELKPKDNHSAARYRLMLHSGSLLVMGNTMQNNWLHQIPKAKGLEEPRINLTFRQVCERSG
ncbi:MAG: alpha-ketoglutarate-dependent dioxygenase AlkB [Gammaproteobacteria bacterium]|jgi:alkylated DNA repair dioxygenase AlkB